MSALLPAHGLLLLAGCSVLMLLTVVEVRPAQATTEAELFQRIFGQRQATVQRSASVALRIGALEYGDVDVVFAADDGAVRLNAGSVIAALEQVLDPDKLALLREELQQQETIDLAWLRSRAIGAEYDRAALTLTLDIPAALRRVENFSFRRRSISGASKDLFRPAALSAYMNIFSDKGFSHGSGAGDRQPVTVALDGALNFKGWVLEADGSWQQDARPAISFGDLRLVRDIVPRSLRFAAGDVMLPATGFQNARATGGLVIAKNFALQPDRITQPAGRRQFTLEQAATVDVFINGTRVKTLRLNAGRHNLRDFPITSGINDVRITVTDQSGQVRELNFPLFSHTELLASGLHEYSYGAGFPVRESGRRYATGRWQFSGFHRYGMTENLTLGANLQLAREQQLVGGEMHLASRLGNFSVDLAMSTSTRSDPGYAVAVGYWHQDASKRERNRRSWELAATASSHDFLTTDELAGSAPPQLDLSIGVSQSLGGDMHASLRGRVQMPHDDGPPATSVGLFFRKRLSRQLNWDISLTRNESFGGKTGMGLATHLSYSFGKGRHHVHTTYDSLQRSHRLGWNRRPRHAIGGFTMALDLEEEDGARSLSGDLDFRGNRFDMGLRHRADVHQPGDRAGVRKSSVSVGTAIVFADNRIGLSRPVTDSFAIIAPHASLGRREITVDARGESWQARSDFLGSAVIPDLSAYRIRTLSVDVTDLAPGYDIGDGLPKVLPGYRSGTVITLGSDANITVRGILRGRGNKAVSLQAGKLVPVDKPDTDAVSFFTNRKGRFQADGLLPGKYELRLLARPDVRLPVDIPEESTGIHDIGELHVR